MIIFLLIILGLFFIGFDSRLFSQSACACLSINEVVVAFLNELDSRIQAYTKQHEGRFPSYAEFRIMNRPYRLTVRTHFSLQSRS